MTVKTKVKSKKKNVNNIFADVRFSGDDYFFLDIQRGKNKTRIYEDRLFEIPDGNTLVVVRKGNLDVFVIGKALTPAEFDEIVLDSISEFNKKDSEIKHIRRKK